MTWPAPTGAPQTDPQVLLGQQGEEASEEVCPDVLAYAATLGKVTPYRLRYLQREYDLALAARVRREDAAAEWSPALTRIVGRSGSRAVDSRVGDRASRHLDNNICGVDAAHTHFEREN